MPVVSPSPQPGVSWEVLGSLGASVDMHQLSVSPSGAWVAARANATGIISRSTDYGNTWSDISTGSTDVNGSIGSAYGGGFFVITDWAGNGVYSSTDGSSWTLRSTGSRDNNRVSYNDGYFVIGSGVAGGGGELLASPDGINWSFSPQTTAFGANSATCGIYVLTQGKTFLAGSQYRYVNDIPTAAVPWVGSATGLSGRVTDVAWSQLVQRAVVTGPSGIFVSNDLINWSLIQSATNMYGVAWCETQFVAVGSLGKIYTSPDGITWATRTSGTTKDLHGVASHNGVIVVVGYDGTVLRSS